jgi:hypothetical protein
MNIKSVLLFAGLAILSLKSIGQQVVYSEPDRSDLRQTNFEILGKLGGNILVYKNLRDDHSISVYDMDMKQVDRIKYKFLPDRIINSDFLAYQDFCYMFYQYQRKGVVYCMAVKIDPSGHNVGEPILMDTTSINFFTSNKIYSVINSEDKQHIAVLKINTKNDNNHLLTTVLFDKDLRLQQKTFMNIAMPERNDYLTEFQLDNGGNLVFARAIQSGSEDNIQKLFLFVKPFRSPTAFETELVLDNIFLDDLRIKADNNFNQYIITSFYSKSRRGNLEGLYLAVWNKESSAIRSAMAMPFDDALRNDAKGENSFKTAFNDYFIRNIIVKKDGGFLMVAEAFYTTGRGGINRGNYMYGSPFMRPSDYYMFSPYSYGYPWWRYNSFNNSQLNRYHAENIVVMAFDSTGSTNWSNVVNKSQWDDDTDATIGYQLVNTGDQLHFLFNQQEKRTMLLADQSIDPKGQLLRNPTLKNLDKGYDFMPRYGKQVGMRQIIFPCMYRNYLCFARVEL